MRRFPAKGDTPQDARLFTSRTPNLPAGVTATTPCHTLFCASPEALQEATCLMHLLRLSSSVPDQQNTRNHKVWSIDNLVQNPSQTDYQFLVSSIHCACLSHEIERARRRNRKPMFALGVRNSLKLRAL